MKLNRHSVCFFILGLILFVSVKCGNRNIINNYLNLESPPKPKPTPKPKPVIKLRPGCAMIFQFPRYQGSSQLVCNQEVRNLQSIGWTGMVESVKVGTGTTVLFYQHNDLKGQRVLVTSNTPLLNSRGFHHIVSSFVVKRHSPKLARKIAKRAAARAKAKAHAKAFQKKVNNINKRAARKKKADKLARAKKDKKRQKAVKKVVKKVAAEKKGKKAAKKAHAKKTKRVAKLRKHGVNVAKKKAKKVAAKAKAKAKAKVSKKKVKKNAACKEIKKKKKKLIAPALKTKTLTIDDDPSTEVHLSLLI